MHNFYVTKNDKNIFTLYIKDVVAGNIISSSRVKIGKVTKFAPYDKTDTCTSFHLYDKKGTPLLSTVHYENGKINFLGYENFHLEYITNKARALKCIESARELLEGI
jgi:hypothetical protein